MFILKDVGQRAASTSNGRCPGETARRCFVRSDLQQTIEVRRAVGRGDGVGETRTDRGSGVYEGGVESGS